MTKLNLELLGGFRLQTNAGEPVPLTTRKAQALLAYLALNPGRAHARPKLAALLWGDRGEAQARDSLRQALSLVRKALSSLQAEPFVAHEDTITFMPMALNTDAIVFEGLVEQQRTESLHEAIGLYRGELLEGFHVPAPAFESWATVERQRLRERAVEAMAKLLDHYLASGAVERGIHIAMRLLAADPLQERVHRTLMELYCRQGRHGTALRQYRTCTELLAKELGIEPDAQTKALHRDILREWNRRQRETSSGDPPVPADPVNKIETEPPVAPRSPERRQLTVLVCDLVGMGALADQLDPKELQDLIDAYQRACKQLISQSGGTAAKLSGAEMQVYFGYPQAREHDAEIAVRAGLSLVEAVSSFNAGCAGPLQLRVGIATGSVWIGDGADHRELVGEAAGIAGSLQAHAEPNTVVIAASTRRLIGGLFDCDDLGQVVLKGFPKPIAAWRVQRTSVVDSRFEALRATSTPLVGREEELELLLRRWRQVAKGDGRVVLLSGEPGIGKSRLTVAVAEALDPAPHSRLRYSCSPHHQDSALYPILNQLQRAAGFRREDTDQQRLDKLEAVLAQSVNDLKDAVPLIANLLSIQTSDRYPPLDLTPQKRKEKTLRALLAQLEGLAGRQPIMMVLEDAHWSDPTSLELLDLMVARVPALPLLLIITFRPEFAAPWIGQPHVTVLTLNRLPPHHRAEMIRGVTGGRALPEEIAEQIIDRTDGVPLFIEELTKTVVESGILVEAGDRYAMSGPVAPVAIPTTLQASLLARLDRLPQAREVAQIGAALGRSFSHDLISAVAQIAEKQLDDSLGQLVSAELIFRRGTAPYAEYTFKHALVQDVAYGTLLREPRRRLHARIAETIERQFPEITESQPELLARHCTEAGLIEKAAGLWGEAGQRSLCRSALVEATEQLRRALAQIAVLPGTPASRRDQIKLQVALINALFHVKGYAALETKAAAEQARLLIEQAQALGEAPEDPLLLFSVLYSFWVANLVAFNSDVCIGLARQFLSLAENQGSTVPLMVGHQILGISVLSGGNVTEGRAHYDQAAALYDPAKHRPLATRFGQDSRVVMLSRRSAALWLLGYPGAAHADAEHALSDAREIGHAATLMYALSHGSLVRYQCGYYTSANVVFGELIELAEEKGALFWKALGLMNQGCACALTGQASDAVRMITSGLAAQQSTGTTMGMPFFFAHLARAHAELGRFQDAWCTIGEALTATETTNERWCEAEVHRNAGEIALLGPAPDSAKAEAYFKRALAAARAQQTKSWELRSAISMARLWCAQGKRDDARDLLAPIYGWFTEGFDTVDLRQAKVLLDELA